MVLSEVIARELLEDWERANPSDSSIPKKCELLIHYAKYDA